tara:strand:- start:1047 stop:1505 length:459 start_codon:yes stop_codon:yes gene_type:complete
MNPYFIAGSVLAVVCAYGTGHWQGDDAGQAKVQAQWDREKAKQMAEYAENMRLAREKEQALQQGANNLREEKDRELKKVADTNRILLGSLRNRPERPAEGSAVSSTASACSGATGAQLAKGDAEFLAGYSADAASLKAALDQCVKQYESLRH